MTSASFKLNHTIKWEDCDIVRYNRNNGIVLRLQRGMYIETIAIIDGADLGVTADDMSTVPTKRATPLFKAMVDVHNQAVSMAYDRGCDNTRKEIREALGIVE